MMNDLVSETKFQQEKFIAYLAGSADPQSQVSSLAEDALKRYVTVDLESQEFILQLADIYLGKSGVSSASIPLKLKIIQYLTKSIAITKCPQHWSKIASDALWTSHGLSKLTSAGMRFVDWICRMAPSEVLDPLISDLIGGFKELTLRQEEQLKGFGFQSIGMIAKRCHEPFHKDLSYFKALMYELSLGDNKMTVYLKEALGMMAEAYMKADQSTKSLLLQMLLEYLKSPNESVVWCCVKWTLDLFPSTLADARFVCLVALSNNSLDTQALAKRGLNVSSEAQPPSFHLMVDCISSRQSLYYISIEAYEFIYDFLGSILVFEAGAMAGDTPIITGYNLAVSLDFDSISRLTLYLNSMPDTCLDRFKVYMSWMVNSLVNSQSHARISPLIYSFLTCLSKDTLTVLFDSHFVFLKLLDSPSFESRSALARITAILVASTVVESTQSPAYRMPAAISPEKSLESTLEILVQSMENSKTFEAKQGSFMALGFTLARLSIINPSMNTQNLLELVLKNAFQYLESTEFIKLQGAILVYGELGRFTPLDTSIRDPLVDKLADLIKTKSNHKIMELALKTLSFLTVADKNISHRVIELLFELPLLLSSLKNSLELNFMIGEAMSIICGGVYCNLVQEKIDFSLKSIYPIHFPILVECSVDICPSLKDSSNDSTGTTKVISTLEYNSGNIPKETSSNRTLVKVLDILSEKIADSQAMKKACVIWLYSIVEHTSVDFSDFVWYLPRIHGLFCVLLKENDDLVQDVAARGLAMAYQRLQHNESYKEEVVRQLVKALNLNKSQDSSMFDPSTLVQDGSTLALYQSILSLTLDFNQPHLVYPLLLLSSQHSVWSLVKRKYQLNRLKKEITIHSKSLLPRLYRMQFDPTTRISQCMKQVYSQLYCSNDSLVHFEAILLYLLDNVTSRSWKVRESCCVALGDLIQGKQVAQVKPFLERIWNVCFYLLDDIKESVRKSSFNTCKSLTNFTIKYCDPQSAIGEREASEMIAIVLPFLLEKGLVSPAEDIQKYSLGVVLKLVQTSRHLLKPSLAQLVSVLLECLSAMEPQAMNYLSFHVEKYNVTNEQFESSRIAATRISPIMEAIEKCIDQIDSTCIASILQVLSLTVKKAVGIPTKAGCARFIGLVCSRVNLSSTDAESLLSCAVFGLNDRSFTIRQAYAAATGYIAKFISESQLTQFLLKMQSNYLLNEDLEQRQSFALVFAEIAKHSPTIFQAHSKDLGPLIVFGMEDPDSSLKKMWVQSWEDFTCGSFSAFLNEFSLEIIEFVERLSLQVVSWRIKQQIALALQWMTVNAAEAVRIHYKRSVQLLVGGLNGRTWNGKEVVLGSFVKVCVSCKEELVADEDLLASVMQVSLREAKRNNKQYKRYAIEALGNLCSGLEHFTEYPEIESILFTLINEIDQDNSEYGAESVTNLNSEERNPSLFNHVQRATCYKAIALCFPCDLQYININTCRICNWFILEFKKGHIWNVRRQILESLVTVMSKVNSAFKASSNNNETVARINMRMNAESDLEVNLVELVALALQDQKYVTVREEAVNLLDYTSQFHLLNASSKANQRDGHASHTDEHNTSKTLTNIMENVPHNQRERHRIEHALQKIDQLLSKDLNLLVKSRECKLRFK